MPSIACCHFPTQLLLLDDDEDFLESIQDFLSEKYKSIGLSDISQAREILIKNHGWTKSLLQEGISRIYQEEDLSLFSISMNVALLKQKIYDPNRFNHIGVIIVDYDMPQESGLKFIRSLEDPQLKIIMLTGKAQQETVIKAFNKKEIHRYVSKGDSDYLQTLLQYIEELQQEFFSDFSKFILDSLKEGETDILENKSFKKLFYQTVQENNIIEYYLLDESGSFFMQDATGQVQIWLLVKSEQEMQHLCELAENDNPSGYVFKQLQNRKSITHFTTRKDSLANAQDWHLLDAQPLDEKKQYYYSIIRNGQHDYFKMDNARIQSYYDYLHG